MHFFKCLSEKSRALRQGAAEAGLGASDSTSADKPKYPRRRRSEKPRSDESAAEAVNTEKSRASKKPRRKPQDERAESERSAASGKAAKKAEQREKRAPRRNPRKKVPAGQLAELLERAKLPKAHNIHLDPKAKVRITPFGGLEQIGMNITVFECDDTTTVVDCGIAFPSEDVLGIDYVIPDISYPKENRSEVRGLVVTHSHEDHIDALPYILKELNMPVYSTKLTIVLIRYKLREHRLLDSAKLSVVKHGDTVPFGDFSVELIKTNHSIPDSPTLAIFSPAGVISHTGDSKTDYTPVLGEAVDLQRMAELSKRGALAMLCDSTNAIRLGSTMSEKTVGRTFDLIFTEHQKNRITVATSASNVDRVQQVTNSAYKYGRKVVVEGRSMVNVIGIANELGYIKISEDTLIEIDQLKDYPPEKTVLITTGSQGESMAALSCMASGMHRKVAINPDDAVIISSHSTPGSEKAVDKIINEPSIKGADVTFQDTHISGHACAEEVKLMHSLLRLKFALPVHGEYRHRKAQVEIAEAVGVPKESTLLMSTGDVVTLTADSCKITGHVRADGILVDDLDVGDVGNVVLRDRRNLAQNGIMTVAIGLQRGSNQLLTGPEAVSRGFVYVKDFEDLTAEAKERVVTAVTDSFDAGVNDWSKLKNVVWDEFNDFFWKKMKRTPVILPIILGVNWTCKREEWDVENAVEYRKTGSSVS